MKLGVSVTLWASQNLGLPNRFHELVRKVTMTQEQVILQSPEMVQQPKLVEEYVEQSLASYSISSVYRTFKPENITVL
jgi:hypothetical protein